MENYFIMRTKLCLSFISLFILITNNEACENYVDPANDPNNIQRPCPDLDVDCIREYFCSNSQCDIAIGPVPDPLFLDYYRLEIANSNLTAELNFVNVEGLNGDIIEFYTNYETQKLVLAVRMNSLKIKTPYAVVKYNRLAKEPIVRSDTADIDFGAVIFTIVFPSICDLRLNEADVFTYVENPVPKYEIGPELSDTSDSTAQHEVMKFYSSVKEDLLEGFLVQGKVFMLNYIQYNICDFEYDNCCDCGCN